MLHTLPWIVKYRTGSVVKYSMSHVMAWCPNHWFQISLVHLFSYTLIIPFEKTCRGTNITPSMFLDGPTCRLRMRLRAEGEVEWLETSPPFHATVSSNYWSGIANLYFAVSPSEYRHHWPLLWFTCCQIITFSLMKKINIVRQSTCSSVFMADEV